MKVKVIKPFKDKYTGTLHGTDEEMELPVSRVNEIIHYGGLIEILEETSGSADVNETESILDAQEESEGKPETRERRKRAEQKK